MFRFHVKVSSSTFGANESGIEPIQFYSHVETLTVQALIARTVERQVEVLLKDQKHLPEVVEETRKVLAKQYLSEQDITAMEQQGSIRLPEVDLESIESQQISVEEEIRYACEAFQQRRFFIIVNGEQVVALDDMVALTENSTVLFIRLMPLVGG